MSGGVAFVLGFLMLALVLFMLAGEHERAACRLYGLETGLEPRFSGSFFMRAECEVLSDGEWLQVSYSEWRYGERGE